jgi:selenocysteine lyase/cysteine desulfurase
MTDLLGPMTIGVVWGRLELLDSMPPYHVGSNMAHEAAFERAVLEAARASGYVYSTTADIDRLVDALVELD